MALGADDGGGGGIAINDVFNRANQKTLSPSSLPFVFVVSFNYQTPAFGSARWMRFATGGWAVGGILRYQSGFPIQVPAAQSNLASYLFRGTFANRVPGQPLFLQDLNCHCYDPNKTFVLNPAAWTDPAPGQWGTSSAYYNDYRQQRHPSESLSFSRHFTLREKTSVELRAQFFNAFNRIYLQAPDSTNAKATQTLNAATGQTTSGFGRINTGAFLLGSAPREGMLMLRLQF